MKELMLFLAVAGILVPVAARLRVSPVLGFLIAGIALGPYGVAAIPGVPETIAAMALRDAHAAQHIGELGILFMMFLIGIELSPARLMSMRRLIFGLGSAQVAACAALIGGLAMWWGNGFAAAAILGLALALSSTAVVMKIITDKGQFAAPAGQAAFAILLLQDLAVVPILFVIALLGSYGAGGEAPALLPTIGKAVGAVVLILAAGRFALRPLLRLVAGARGGPEYFMACVIMALLAAALVADHAGMSMALGAFLAGLVLAETEFRNQIEVELEPFRGLFMGVFFMGVGMAIDVTAVADNLPWLVAGMIGLFAVKAAAITALCVLFGLKLPTAARTGITLGQAGEFAFIIVGMAVAARVIPVDTGHFMVLLTALTLAATPLAYRLGEGCEKWLLRRYNLSLEDVAADVSRDIAGHVVIAGFGRTGQAVARILEEHQIPYLALEADGHALDRLRREGKPVFMGDASSAHALEKVHAHRARCVILALNDRKSAHRTIRSIRQNCPNAVIYARAHDEHHARELEGLGVNATVQEVEGVSRYLAQRVLADVG